MLTSSSRGDIERAQRSKTVDKCLLHGDYEAALSLYQKELDYLSRHNMESKKPNLYRLTLYDIALASSFL